MSPKEFFSVELGLFFLTEHYPDEPVGALWPMISGYVACPPELEPVLRRLHLLMGEVGRSNFIPLCLDKYRRAHARIQATARRAPAPPSDGGTHTGSSALRGHSFQGQASQEIRCPPNRGKTTEANP
ncbi:hypothetical protein [Saccharopolyspora pogona]|uniref:hypothetical protein n=1 Tax=Saccharopolyspora pogona TaxID=333966 RepID=UPI001CC234C8